MNRTFNLVRFDWQQIRWYCTLRDGKNHTIKSEHDKVVQTEGYEWKGKVLTFLWLITQWVYIVSNTW